MMMGSTSRQALIFFFIVFNLLVRITGTPVSSESWVELISTDGVKFTGRNAHASCVFKGRIWVAGGRTNAYTMYNLLESYTVADVWSSANGAIWSQQLRMVGDYFAQNTDVVQPGPIAPWYARYGHSLDAIDTDGDGAADMMLLMGGFSPYPSNDMWVTEDGNNWIYCGLAPWTPRAWHGTVILQNKLYLMGGTPLNNEVWMLNNVSRIARREPSTRSLYSNYTFELHWTQLPNAPWSPRVGMGLVAQYYFDVSKKQTVADAQERIVLIGGYGGWMQSLEDGGVWSSYDARSWQLLNASSALGGRAWMGVNLMRSGDGRFGLPVKDSLKPPKIFVFGGGFIGGKDVDDSGAQGAARRNTRANKKRVVAMSGYSDAFWSRDGATWVRISYQEGGGMGSMPFYSSQEWAKTIVDTATVYLGMWGHSIESFNISTKEEYPGDFFLIAGDFTEGGDMSDKVFQSKSGLYCDIEGVICGRQGICIENGCVCNTTFAGENCEEPLGPEVSGAARRWASTWAGLGLAATAFLLWVAV